jgi:hypothetical protein
VINTDPHPGNYLFHPDGTVTFLDFGCVKQLTEDQVQTIIGFLRRTVDQDANALYQWGIDSGWVGPPDPPSPAELLAYWSDGWRYLLPPQPFTFTPGYVAEVMRNRISSTSPHNQVNRKLAVPGNFMLTLRMETGMTAALGGLHATGLWRAIREEYDRGGPPSTPRGELDAAFWGARR